MVLPSSSKCFKRMQFGLKNIEKPTLCCQPNHPQTVQNSISKKKIHPVSQALSHAKLSQDVLISKMLLASTERKYLTMGSWGFGDQGLVHLIVTNVHPKKFLTSHLTLFVLLFIHSFIHSIQFNSIRFDSIRFDSIHFPFSLSHTFHLALFIIVVGGRLLIYACTQFDVGCCFS